MAKWKCYPSRKRSFTEGQKKVSKFCFCFSQLLMQTSSRCICSVNFFPVNLKALLLQIQQNLFPHKLVFSNFIPNYLNSFYTRKVFGNMTKINYVKKHLICEIIKVLACSSCNRKPHEVSSNVELLIPIGVWNEPI